MTTSSQAGGHGKIFFAAYLIAAASFTGSWFSLRLYSGKRRLRSVTAWAMPSQVSSPRTAATWMPGQQHPRNAWSAVTASMISFSPMGIWLTAQDVAQPGGYLLAARLATKSSSRVNSLMVICSKLFS